MQSVMAVVVFFFLPSYDFAFRWHNAGYCMYVHGLYQVRRAFDGSLLLQLSNMVDFQTIPFLPLLGLSFNLGVSAVKGSREESGSSIRRTSWSKGRGIRIPGHRIWKMVLRHYLRHLTYLYFGSPLKLSLISWNISFFCRFFCSVERL